MDVKRRLFCSTPEIVTNGDLPFSMYIDAYVWLPLPVVIHRRIFRKLPLFLKAKTIQTPWTNKVLPLDSWLRHVYSWISALETSAVRATIVTRVYCSTNPYHETQCYLGRTYTYDKNGALCHGHGSSADFHAFGSRHFQALLQQYPKEL